MTWASRMLRGNRVWVKLGESGEPLAGPDGRVEVLYKPGGKVYRAGVRNLEPDPNPRTLPVDAGAGAGGEDEAGETEAGPRPAKVGRVTQAAPPKDAVVVYTDGACTGNPGPMGIGVVILDGEERREVSEYLGPGTNNIAELTAILRGLELCPRDRPVVVHSDSSYALGLLGQGWRAKANQALVERLRALGKEFRDLRLVKVRGHAGVPENERCDELARDAISRRR